MTHIVKKTSSVSTNGQAPMNIPGCNEPFLIRHITPRLLWQQVSSISLRASLMLAVEQESCYVKPGAAGRKRK